MLPNVLSFSLLALALFAAVLACLEIGWRIRHGRRHEEHPDADSGLSAIDGAVYGLMGLLIAFTFTGATNLASPEDTHLHHLVLQIDDAEHFTETWTIHEKGHDTKRVFKFTRRK